MTDWDAINKAKEQGIEFAQAWTAAVMVVDKTVDNMPIEALRDALRSEVKAQLSLIQDIKKELFTQEEKPTVDLNTRAPEKNKRLVL